MSTESEHLAEPSRHPDPAVEFSLREYAALRSEILWLLRDYRGLERNIVIAVGVSWGWLFDHPHSPRFAWLLPILFVALGILRASGIFKQFGVFRD